jgi:20S proteasome subunit alpha 7
VSWSWQECESLFTPTKISLTGSIHLVHDDNKDKDFELEMTWVCAESGNKHKAVPAELLAEADAKGKAALEEGMEED